MAGKNSVKDIVLLRLKKEKQMTIAQLGEYFNISDIALRRHIHTLEREGFIKSIVEKQTLGRPYYLYALTEKGHAIFPSHYQQFSEDLLLEIEDLKGKPFVYELLANRSDKEKLNYKSALSNSRNFDEKIKKLVDIQEEKGYMTELRENEDGSFELRQFNCPILRIAYRYKEVCNQEVDLFSDILDSECKVSATSCIVNGSNCCSFIFQKSD
ncbi:helix-turn-helix transcriptional regulator [Aquibacillus rhizosphaerae]|uniref:Transcriptional regulator n=1 Tax=Aquibacillus rhizosphaerae TaxID=3051431 RepID=A0ABT7L275_9BACI|nr:transcriptional regulator [Aquibacillus sp. LR5S19]MDL4839952.1 transcriptional regulator [Aquibacillus sp. LR5S19]